MNFKFKDVLYPAAFAICFIAMVFFFSTLAGYALTYREQQQLFLFTWRYVGDVALNVGGIATLVARFIVQFFTRPVYAISVTALLLTLSAFLSWKSLKRSGVSAFPLLLAFVPTIIMAGCIADNSIHYDALVAFLMAQTALAVYVGKCGNCVWSGPVMVLVLYFLAGPAALLFAVCAFVADLFCQGRKVLVPALDIIFAASICLIGFILAQAPTLSAALTPEFYFEITEKMPLIQIVSWASLPLILALALLLSLKKCRTFVRVVLTVIMLLASVAYTMLFYPKSLSADELYSYMYEYYAEKEDWAQLAQLASRNMSRYNDANYYHLAKAEMGTLMEDLFDRTPYGQYSLFYYGDVNQSADPRLARILLSMGNLSAAQNVAFNAIPTHSGYKPSMIKMNVTCELVRGTYELAEKYIDVLKHSLFYHKWAVGQEKFLRNDALVESDPVLGRLRRSFITEEHFVMDSPLKDLYFILDSNPEDSKTMEWAASFQLLSKDFDMILSFVEKYYGTPALKTLPVHFQEAMVFFWDYYKTITKETAVLRRGMSEEQYERFRAVDEEYCRAHGVTDETFKRFDSFKSAYSKGHGNAPEEFRDTFWNYMVFVNL